MFLAALQNRMNPFEAPEDENLYNIGTGKAAPPEVATFLVNIEKVGNMKN